jgi:hypothetical protein
MAWRTRLALLGFLGVGGFFLVMEHRAHLVGILPLLLLLLACPLLHRLAHGGHGQNDDGRSHAEHRRVTG